MQCTANLVGHDLDVLARCKVELLDVTVTVPKDSTAANPTKCNVVGVVLAALSKATANDVPGSP